MQSFVVWSDEIEGRLDPSPYHPVRIDSIKKIKSTNTKLLPLKEVVIFKKEIITSNPSGLPYIGLENIESNMGILIPSKDTKETFGSACTFQKGDILFPKLRPYLNKVYLAEFDGVCSTEFHVLKAKKCNSRYLFSFLSSDLIVSQTSYLMTGNALPRLQTDEIKELLIPLPSDEIQNAIDNFIQSAYNQKQQKEAEAQRLLDSIDGYVLEALGMKMPEVEDKMFFVVSSDEVHNSRIDAYYYQPRFEKIEKVLGLVGYKEFNDLIEIITKGETPLWRGDIYLSKGIPFLKVQNISQAGIKDELTYISEEVHDRMKRSQLNGGELLYTMAGTIGIATIFPENFGVANINQAIAKIVLKREVNKEYIKCVLNSNICKLQTQRFLTTSAQPNINFEQIKSLEIPFPPLEIQNKIAEEVKRRMSEAERLKAEAGRIIEEAKKKVEGMILAGD